MLFLSFLTTHYRGHKLWSPPSMRHNPPPVVNTISLWRSWFHLALPTIPSRQFRGCFPIQTTREIQMCHNCSATHSSLLFLSPAWCWLHLSKLRRETKPLCLIGITHFARGSAMSISMQEKQLQSYLGMSECARAWVCLQNRWLWKPIENK